MDANESSIKKFEKIKHAETPIARYNKNCVFILVLRFDDHCYLFYITDFVVRALFFILQTHHIQFFHRSMGKNVLAKFFSL